MARSTNDQQDILYISLNFSKPIFDFCYYFLGGEQKIFTQATLLGSYLEFQATLMRPYLEFQAIFMSVYIEFKQL